MAVGALTPVLGVADYSCAGTGGAGLGGAGIAGPGGQVDIAAPGDNILSAKSGGGYRRESGTSMATAFVAGVAALLWEQYPGAGAGDIWARLTQQAWRLNLSAADIGAGLCALRN
jgi:subtilisin